MKRRQYLAVLGGVSGTVLAGCSGNSDDSPTTTGTNDHNNSISGVKNNKSNSQHDVTESDLEAIVAETVDVAYEYVSPTCEQSVPQNDLTRQWESNISPLGEFIQFTSIDYQGKKQGFDVVGAQGVFADGRAEFSLKFDGQMIQGFVFNVDIWTPPEYVDQSVFTEQNLALAASDDCELGATVTIPNGSNPIPGVVLVHGSGDQDRDQQVGPNSTFKEIAWGLATRGVGVLRYDQRPVACDIDRTEATADDLITDDALIALERLREYDRVEKTFVAGHSLGGRFAPRIAAQDDALDGVIMLAPLAEPISDAIVRQSKYQLEINANLTDEQRQAELAQVEALAKQIRTLDIDDDELINLGGGKRGKPFFRTLQQYDHVETAASLDIPRFILQGGRDYLVTVEDDLAIWEDKLSRNPEVQIKRYERLNHRFQPGQGVGRPSEWFKPNPVDRRVIVDIATFITGRRS
jgi:pimeloyl-ACP methyl ester carboxylesterase